MDKGEAREVAADLTAMALRKSMPDARTHVERYSTACIEVLPYCDLTYVEGSNEGRGLAHLLGTDHLFTVHLTIARTNGSSNAEPEIVLNTDARHLEGEAWTVALKSRYVATAENDAPGLETTWKFTRSGHPELQLTGSISPIANWISASESFARALAERVGFRVELPELV